MGHARNLGAYATFGLVTTTKQKDAEGVYEERRQEYQKRLAVYNDVLGDIQDAVDAMMTAYGAAQEALLSVGALKATEDNTVGYGWYKPLEGSEPVDNRPDYTRTAIGAIPAFGVGISTPAVVWALVSIYGTAATGTAISATSGAATTTAVAAWIGRAVTLGRGGMMAGGMALGPIALVSTAVTMPLGFLIARNREKNYIQRADDAMEKMAVLQEIVADSQDELKKLRQDMILTTDSLQTLTTQLQATTPDTPESHTIVNDLDDSMRKTKAHVDDLEKIIKARDNSIESAGLSDEDEEEE